MTRYGISIEYGSEPDDWDVFFATMKAVGKDFIVRTLTDVTSTELTAAATAGVDHVFVWRSTPNRASGGYAAGAVDATAAVAALTALSIVTTCPVYYAVEYDATGYEALLYFNGIQSVVALGSIGVLGPWKVVEYFNTLGTTVSYSTQIIEWSYGHGWHVDMSIIQTETEYAIGGMTCRKYENRATAFGQYRSGAGVEPTAPSTIPLPIKSPAQPHGGIIRYGRQDDFLVLKLKNEDGNVTEYQGRVSNRSGGLAPRILCESVESTWNNTACEWQLNNVTLGTAVRLTVENPSGAAPTGIICHVEEPDILQSIPVWPVLSQGAWNMYVKRAQELLNIHGADPEIEVDSEFGSGMKTAVEEFQADHGLHVSGIIDQATWQALAAGTYGGPLVLQSWSGIGKSVLTVLDEFCELTGCQWTMKSFNGQYHFYFGHPANWPSWDTITDESDEDTPGTERRCLSPNWDNAVTQENSGYINRVYYPRTITPPSRPPGVTYWDTVWSDDPTKWRNYGNGVIIDGGPKMTSWGTQSIHFQKSFTMSSGFHLPHYIDLGYMQVPGTLSDMSSWYWGTFWARVRGWVSTDQGTSPIPRSTMYLCMVLHSGAYPGPNLDAVSSAAVLLYPSKNVSSIQSWTLWNLYGNLTETKNEAGETLFDPTNIHWIQFRLMLSDPVGAVALADGKTWTASIWIDDMQPLGTKPEDNSPNVSQAFVETQAVSDGIEQPIAMTLFDESLPYQDSETVAMLSLANGCRTRVTLEDLQIRGIVDPPIMSRFPVNLSSIGMTDISLNPLKVTHRPGEDTTEVSLGDKPYDEAHADNVIRRSIDKLRAQK